MLEARAQGQRLVDAWQATANRQIAALDELADGVLVEGESTGHELASYLCSFWVGCWADAIHLLHETCSACVHPPECTPVTVTNPPPVIAFVIESIAEAADPIVIPGVTPADAPNLATNPLTTPGPPSASIPPANVRVTTYRARVLLSLVALGKLNLVPGVYQGNLDLGGIAFAQVQVTVT